MYRIEHAWTPTHKYWRISRNWQAVLGFWYAHDEYGQEFAITIGRTFYLFQTQDEEDQEQPEKDFAWDAYTIGNDQ